MEVGMNWDRSGMHMRIAGQKVAACRDYSNGSVYVYADAAYANG